MSTGTTTRERIADASPATSSSHKRDEAQGAARAATETYLADRRGSEHAATPRFARAAQDAQPSTSERDETQGAARAATETYLADRRGSEHAATPRFARAAQNTKPSTSERDEAQGAARAATETYLADRRGSEHAATPRFARAAVLGPGFRALFGKEVLRFWKVAFQTIVAPVVTTLLYLLIFSHVLDEHVRVYDGRVAYTAFLVPGLIMMSVLQNAFANSSSSLIQSKMMRNLIFILLPPITSLEIYLAYVLGAVVRGLAVGLGVWLVTLPFVPWHALVPDHPLWIVTFAFFGSFALGTLGLIAGIWSEKFDHLAVFQNFFIMPLTFLSGVFYSIHSLPAFWQTVSHANPFFYMIDGFRYGFFGVADVSPWLSLAILLLFNLVLSAVALRMLVTGYKLRS